MRPNRATRAQPARNSALAPSRFERSSEPVPWAIELAAAVICKRWKPVIVCMLLRGNARFGVLARALPGVSAKVLSQQLRELERDEVVVHDRSGRWPVYGLTPIGCQLVRVINDLHAWGIAYRDTSKSAIARHGLAQLYRRGTPSM